MADDDSRAGQRYDNPAILRWLEQVHTPMDPALRRAFDAPKQQDMPAIQVGRTDGKLIELICRLTRVHRVVEIGTLAGFSAIHLARALPADGHLWTIEHDPRHAAVARGNLAAAGFADRVTVVEGDGPDVLMALEPEGPFDALFVDADKERYDQYGRWAARHIRRGGVLLADNAFFFGKLLADRPAAASVRRMHEEATQAFDTVCIPTADGLLLGIKR